jgi:cytosine/adenosine deaminase-related metal-dependent hydrolase
MILMVACIHSSIFFQSHAFPADRMERVLAEVAVGTDNPTHINSSVSTENLSTFKDAATSMDPFITEAEPSMNGNACGS